MSHAWIDLRGVRDEVMRRHDMDYFENSRRAVAVHKAYAQRNASRFKGYGVSWGLTASDGPGGADHWGYKARGAPYGPDDGTFSMGTVAASLPFAPADVQEALSLARSNHPEAFGEYGCKSAVNPTFLTPEGKPWASKGYYAVDQGPVAMMIENHQSGLIWQLMSGCEPVRRGLKRAGFSGGWLDSEL